MRAFQTRSVSFAGIFHVLRRFGQFMKPILTRLGLKRWHDLLEVLAESLALCNCSPMSPPLISIRQIICLVEMIMRKRTLGAETPMSIRQICSSCFYYLHRCIAQVIEICIQPQGCRLISSAQRTSSGDVVGFFNFITAPA